MPARPPAAPPREGREEPRGAAELRCPVAGRRDPPAVLGNPEAELPRPVENGGGLRTCRARGLALASHCPRAALAPSVAQTLLISLPTRLLDSRGPAWGARRYLRPEAPPPSRAAAPQASAARALSPGHVNRISGSCAREEGHGGGAAGADSEMAHLDVRPITRGGEWGRRGSGPRELGPALA